MNARPRKTRHWVATAVATAAVGLSLAACSSSSSSGSAAAKASSGGAASGAPSGAPITVGNISSLTNAGGTFNGFEAGVAAYFSYANANGGVDGHHVKFVSFDDGANPSQNASDARTLVEQDNALAIVGEASLADAASQKYLQSAGVPVVGGWAASSAWHKPATNMFVSLEGPNLPYCGLWSNQLAKAAGVTKMVFVAQNFPSAVQDAKCRQAAAKYVGIQVVPQIITVSTTQVDYTGPMQQAMASGANGIYFSSGGSGIIAAVKAGQELGYKGYYIPTQPSGLLTGLASVSGLSGRILTSSFGLLPDTQSAAMATFRKAMQTYAPKFANSITAVSGWAAGVEFAAALKNGGATRTGIMSWLSKQTNFTFDGLQGPMNWTLGSHPNPCTVGLVYKNGAWTPGPGANDGPFTCGPDISPTTGKVLIPAPSGT